MTKLNLIERPDSFVYFYSWILIGRKEDGFNSILEITQTQLPIENPEKTNKRIEIISNT
jgi:hypothetical protein